MKIKEKEKEILHQIRKIRNQRGYSQHYLALKLNIEQSSYQKIETGCSTLKINQFISILEILEIEILDFFDKCSFIKKHIAINTSLYSNEEILEKILFEMKNNNSSNRI